LGKKSRIHLKAIISVFIFPVSDTAGPEFPVDLSQSQAG
jgi:hypothetical protein